MSRHAMILAACFGAAASLFTVRAQAAELTVMEFEKLHKELASVKEPWQELPWQLSLVKACSQAAKEKKPVYLLCRSGHPLGCV